MSIVKKIKVGFWILNRINPEISLWDVWKIWRRGNNLRKLATEEVMAKESGESKPGWRTTEFWLTLLANAPMIACTFGGEQSLPCLIAGVLATIAYNWKRGTLKESALVVASGYVNPKARKK